MHDLTEFLACVESNGWNTMPSLRQIPQFSGYGFSVSITTSTARYLESLLDIP
jgi:hypothetical protein